MAHASWPPQPSTRRHRRHPAGPGRRTPCQGRPGKCPCQWSLACLAPTARSVSEWRATGVRHRWRLRAGATRSHPHRPRRRRRLRLPGKVRIGRESGRGVAGRTRMPSIASSHERWTARTTRSGSFESETVSGRCVSAASSTRTGPASPRRSVCAPADGRTTWFSLPTDCIPWFDRTLLRKCRCPEHLNASERRVLHWA
jgi:hypothetical protein